MTPEALQVARDALLEAGSIADVLDLARTMAIKRVARGLPVAWVGLSPRIREVWARVAWPIDGQWLVGTIEWAPATRGHHVDWLRRPVTPAEVARHLTLAVALIDVDMLDIDPPRPRQSRRLSYDRIEIRIGGVPVVGDVEDSDGEAP